MMTKRCVPISILVLVILLLSFSLATAQSRRGGGGGSCRCNGFIRRQRIFGRNAGTQWSSVALQILEEVNNNPDTTLLVPPIARNLALFSSCTYDTFCVLTQDCKPVLFKKGGKVKVSSSVGKSEVSKQVSFAAFTALERIFGRVFRQASRQLRRDGLRERDVSGSIGNQICDAVIAARANDGANEEVRFRQTNDNSTITFDAECTKFEDPDGWQPLCIPPPQPNAQQPTFAQTGAVVASTTSRQLIFGKASPPVTSAVRQISEGSDDTGESRLPSLALAGEDAPQCVPQEFPTPQFGTEVTPFAPATRTIANNLRPAPNAGTSEFDEEFDDVLDTSGTLDDRKKTVAEYWDDNPFRTFPPGQWFRVSLQAAAENKISLKNTLALQMTMGMAQLDAAIAAWTTKFNENLVRPITVIQCTKAGQRLTAWTRPYLGVRTFTQTGNETWRAYLETPPFPGYVSGHSTFGAAGETILKSFFGNRYIGPNCFRRRRGRSEVEPRIPPGRPGHIPGLTDVANSGPRTRGFSPARRVDLCWRTFTEASDENGISRIYGGVHINDDNKFGLLLGRKVGEVVDRRAREFTGIETGGGERR